MTLTSIQSRGNFTSHREHTLKKSMVVRGAGASALWEESPKLIRSELPMLASSFTGTVLGLAHSLVPGRLPAVGGLEIFWEALVAGRAGELGMERFAVEPPSREARLIEWLKFFDD